MLNFKSDIKYFFVNWLYQGVEFDREFFWGNEYGMFFCKSITATFASLFYIGITVGRFISGFATDNIGDRKMIQLGTGILTCGIIALLVPVDSYILAFIAFLVIGLGCAPIYPCIIHSTSNNFGAENSGAIIGIQMASAYVGSTFIPPLFGLLGNSIGFAIMPVCLLVFLVLMITMVELTFRITNKNQNAGKAEL